MTKDIDIDIEIEKIKETLDKVVRRQEDIGRKLDNLDSDRGIFEDILGRLTSLEEKIKFSRSHDIEVKKDIKNEINEASQRVEDKVEEVQNLVEKRKFINVKRLTWWESIKAKFK